MKVAIVGSRECGGHHKRKTEILAVLRAYLSEHVHVELVSGGAMGIDMLANRCAVALGLFMIEFLPDWKGLGKRAGFERNKTIVENCDELHAWWDGKSRGTKHLIDLARKAGKPVVVHTIGEEP